MDKERYYAKGRQLESALTTSSIFKHDGGLHLSSYKVTVDNKYTVIDNMSIYGSIILVLEAKNYTFLEGVSNDRFWKGRGRGNKFTLHNTLRQNLYHVKMLSQYLSNKGIDTEEYRVLHYIIVPDSCDVYVDDEVRKHLLFESELTSLKQALANYNQQPNDNLVRVIKEGLF